MSVMQQKSWLNRLGSGWMIISAAGFATMGFTAKILMKDMHFSPSESVFWRMLVAVFVLGGLTWKRGQTLKTPHFTAQLTRAAMGLTSLLMYFYLITRLPLSTAVTLSYTSVIWFIILSIFWRRKVKLSVAVCALVGFVGVILMLQPVFKGGQKWLVIPGMATGMTAALAYIQVKQLTLMQEPEWRIVFYFSLISAIVSGIWTVFLGFHPLTLKTIGLIVVLGLAGLVGQLCMTLAYAKGNLFISSILSYLTIVFAFNLGALFLHQRVDGKELLGALMIILSGVASNAFNQKKIKFKEKSHGC